MVLTRGLSSPSLQLQQLSLPATSSSPIIRFSSRPPLRRGLLVSAASSANVPACDVSCHFSPDRIPVPHLLVPSGFCCALLDPCFFRRVGCFSCHALISLERQEKAANCFSVQR